MSAGAVFKFHGRFNSLNEIKAHIHAGAEYPPQIGDSAQYVEADGSLAEASFTSAGWIERSRFNPDGSTSFAGSVVAPGFADPLGVKVTEQQAFFLENLADYDIWTAPKTMNTTFGGVPVSLAIPTNFMSAATVGKTFRLSLRQGLQFVLPTDIMITSVVMDGATPIVYAPQHLRSLDLPSGRAHICAIEFEFFQLGWDASDPQNPRATGRAHGKTYLISTDGTTQEIDVSGFVGSGESSWSIIANAPHTLTISTVWNARSNFNRGCIKTADCILFSTAGGAANVGAVIRTSAANPLDPANQRKLKAASGGYGNWIINGLATNGVDVVACGNVGGVGVLSLSRDGGKSFQKISITNTAGTGNLACGCYNATTKTFFFAGDAGKIIKSTDFGLTWQDVASGVVWNIYSIIPTTSGFTAVGNSTTQYLTSTDGTTVTTPTNTTSQVLNTICVKADGKWLAGGASGATMYYNGTTVATGKTVTGVTLYASYFDEVSGNWWMGGSTLWKAPDPSSGGTWTQATLPSTGFDTWASNVSGIASLGNYMIITNGSGTCVFFSTNQGIAWQRLGYTSRVYSGDAGWLQLHN